MIRAIALITLLFSFSANADQPCAKNFESFLASFQSNHNFQTAHTSYPLKYSYVNSFAEPDPQTIKISISSTKDPQVKKLPSYPTIDKIKLVPFEQKISKEPNGVYIVGFTKPDTDYTFDFRFISQNSCWRLFEINDYSL